MDMASILHGNSDELIFNWEHADMLCNYRQGRVRMVRIRNCMQSASFAINKGIIDPREVFTSIGFYLDIVLFFMYNTSK